jgi:hypothetical protein
LNNLKQNPMLVCTVHLIGRIKTRKFGSNTQTVSYHRASLSSTRQKPLEFVAKTNLVQVIVPSQVLHHHESHCQLLSCTSGKCEEGRLPRLSQVKTSEMMVTIALPCAIYHNNILRIIKSIMRYINAE